MHLLVARCITSQTLCIPHVVVSVWTQQHAECKARDCVCYLATDSCISNEMRVIAYF